MIPMTVLGWTVQRSQSIRSVVCSRATTESTSLLQEEVELAEEEEERDDHDHADEERSHEQRAEHFRIVLEVHVEHHDNHELRRRHDEQRRDEQAVFGEWRV